MIRVIVKLYDKNCQKFVFGGQGSGSFWVDYFLSMEGDLSRGRGEGEERITCIDCLV